MHVLPADPVDLYLLANVVLAPGHAEGGRGFDKVAHELVGVRRLVERSAERRLQLGVGEGVVARAIPDPARGRAEERPRARTVE